jgi:hypothetical protein
MCLKVFLIVSMEIFSQALGQGPIKISPLTPDRI